MIVFDMNHRERARFADQLGTLRNALDEAIAALQAEDDQQFFIAMFMFAAMGPAILNDITPVFNAMQNVDMSDLDKPIEEE